MVISEEKGMIILDRAKSMATFWITTVPAYSVLVPRSLIIFDAKLVISLPADIQY